MGKNGKTLEMSSVAATFEKANTYDFAEIGSSSSPATNIPLLLNELGQELTESDFFLPRLKIVWR